MISISGREIQRSAWEGGDECLGKVEQLVYVVALVECSSHNVGTT